MPGERCVRPRVVVERSQGIPAAHHRVTARCAAFAEHFQPPNAGNASRPARLHAFPDPHFFLCQQLVCFGKNYCFLRLLLFFLYQVLGEVAGIGQQLAAVEFNDSRGDLV